MNRLIGLLLVLYLPYMYYINTSLSVSGGWKHNWKGLYRQNTLMLVKIFEGCKSYVDLLFLCCFSQVDV